jgi:prephenate dehydratase
MILVGVLGPKGTFSDYAAQKYFKNKDFQIKYFNSIDKTFEMADQMNYIIIPIENTIDGYVQQNLDLIFSNDLVIIDEIYLPIKFSLIANSNNFETINKVYVQYIAKSQCKKILSKLDDKEIILTESNMQAFDQIKKGNKNEAGIISSHMVDQFNQFKINDVTDMDFNETRFFVLSHQIESILANEMKISIVVVPTNDRPGLLYDILGIFKHYNINLTSIISRPTKNEIGSYYFFIDMNYVSFDQVKVFNAIDQIKNEFEIKVLGIYPNRK